MTRHDDTDTRLGGTAGTIAERAFVVAMEARGYKLGERVWRYGLDQLETRGNDNAVATLGPFLLHTPDFVGVGGYAYEVQGGRGGFRVKREKLEALWHFWHLNLRATAEASGAARRQVRWFLFDDEARVAYWLTFERVLAIIQHDPRVEYHEELLDRKDGWYIPVECITDRLVRDAFEAARATETRAAQAEKRRLLAEPPPEDEVAA